jgi:hypothetical protein
MTDLIWKHKDIWKVDGDTFLIEVVRWSSPEYSQDYTEILGQKQHWNVYAYIYPEHPLFDKLDKTHSNWYNQPIHHLNFHCGCTFMQWYVNEKGEFTSAKLGSDYGHYRDNFEHISTKEDAWQVFGDAKTLYNQLLQLQKDSDEQAKPNSEDFPTKP